MRRVLFIGRLVEVRNISINDLKKDEQGDFLNRIELSPKKQELAKNLASESELHRILLHLQAKNSSPCENDDKLKEKTYTPVEGYFTLDVGENVKRYETLIENDGKLEIVYMMYELDEDGNKKLDEQKNHYSLLEEKKETYISTFCGAGHSRNQKNLFVREDLTKDMNKILLCGIPEDLIYDKPSKWNAYYSLVTTDSTPLKEVPNIVVIDDYKKTITTNVDLVDGINVTRNQPKEIKITPFDGAGLVTAACAEKWAKELNCTSAKGEAYIPSCFQIRMLPGIKGELMVFDLVAFAKEQGVSKIIDLGGKEWDIFEDKIDIVLTKSQFKFWNLYLDENGNFDYWKWRNEFDKECGDYKRTLNIASYPKHPSDLKKKTLLSYQPLQSIDFTDEEIAGLSKKGLGIYKKIVSDVDEFLKYRSLIIETGEDDDVEEVVTDEFVPPYYKALLKNKELFYDPYISEKIENDVLKLKNNILAGKVFVDGNYQVLMPDLYGLAEWVFHDELGTEPEGLLKGKYYIYSEYWNLKEKKEVDMIRNPAVGMEQRICQLQDGDELKKWYKYQTTGIVTGMYDDLALVLGGADFDGDTVVTTDSAEMIAAVKRELGKDHGLLVCEKDKKKEDQEKQDEQKQTKKNVIQINKTSDIMKVNAVSFKNSIGKVINKVTDLWTWIKTNEEIVRDYIAIGSIVGSKTIDFAKTGEPAVFPKGVITFLEDKERGHWMRYLPKFYAQGISEKKAICKAKEYRKPIDEIEKLISFADTDCTMNRLCHYAEAKILEIDLERTAKMMDVFEPRSLLLKEKVPISRAVANKLEELQNEYVEISAIYRKEKNKSKSHQKAGADQYKWFYTKCRVELLMVEQDINKLLDVLIELYYGLGHNKKFEGLSKDILWNAFPNEMIIRSTKQKISRNIDKKKLEKQHEKMVEAEKKKSESKRDKKKVQISKFDNKESAVLTMADRKYINSLVDEAHQNGLIIRTDNVYKIKRVLAILLYLCRKAQKQWILKVDNVPNELTDSTLGKLVDVNHKYIDASLMLLEKIKAIKTEITMSGVKIEVNRLEADGDVWFETDDYNKAGTKVRSYFRK